MRLEVLSYLLSVADAEPVFPLHAFVVIATNRGTGGGVFYSDSLPLAVAQANAVRAKRVELTVIVYEKECAVNEEWIRHARSLGVDTFFGLPLYMPLGKNA